MITLKKFVAIVLILAICLFVLPDAIPLDYEQGDQTFTFEPGYVVGGNANANVGDNGQAIAIGGNANAITGNNGQAIAIGGPAIGGNGGNGGSS
ncbi:210_t:CDS:2 [Ambispora leptoticha]|uniref:210_t:CDS:1 n=1 Tax=Ambispora leptoticha TaxID=144679 RepID=A0A9N9E171_9GLOM|nr:210_t:CDS:2 [Ambispora leptoticha]